jgi:hypothetical protein
MTRHHEVVIAAAVAALFGGRARVRSIRERRAGEWDKEGRANVQKSHEVAAPLIRFTRGWGRSRP